MPRKMGKIIIAGLKKRSRKGLSFAKEMLLAEKMEYPKLREALEHYLVNWNDSTHPGLFSLACEAVGGHPDDVLSGQASIAMMAAAFDIHDDILDKSTEKHKVPTIYGKFGTEIALLLGNAFLIEGLRLFAESTVDLPMTSRKIALETIKKLLFEVGNAHALEIGFKERQSTDPEEYLRIIEMKAAAIEADIYLGALFCKARDPEIATLSRLGRILGILVTLREEFIDVFEAEELRQRLFAKDLPLPLLSAMLDQKLKEKILKITSKKKLGSKDADSLLSLVIEAEPVMNIKRRMQLLVEEGLSLSSKLTQTKQQTRLQAILSFMLEDL
jgi:geranylgeranyl pyrophosphate synthase